MTATATLDPQALIARARANAQAAAREQEARASFQGVRDAQGAWVIEDSPEIVEHLVLMGWPVTLYVPGERPRLVRVVRAGRRFVNRIGEEVARGYWSPIDTDN